MKNNNNDKKKRNFRPGAEFRKAVGQAVILRRVHLRPLEDTS